MKHYKVLGMIVFLVLAYGAPVHATPVTYWNVFNLEGESSLGAGIATYATLTDMFMDTNRTGVFFPDGPGTSEANIVGSGATIMAGPGPNPIPEPSTILLLGTGLAGLIAWRRKTRHCS